jgi:signal peptidase I
VEPERTWRQASPPDLNSRIADNIRRRKHGRHSSPKRSRHGATPAAPASRRHLRGAVRLLLMLLVTAGIVGLLRTFVIASFYIPSESMEPTLHGCATCQPDRVLVDKLSYRFRGVSRTDVVVFRKPADLHVEDKDLIKRVIGLPGDSVRGQGGSVYINDRKLSEPYVNPACGGTADFGPVLVPDGRYFVMGDNRCNSSDSRVFGPITRQSILGQAFAVVWPAKHLRRL